MRKAFSMVELIFIIVLMGILAKVASSFMPDNRLLNDTHYVSMKIKEAQKNAIGYDSFQFGGAKIWDINRSDFNLTCIDCNKTFFENLDHNFSLISTISPPQKFCFDSLGRPYELNTTNNSEQLLLNKIDINVTYNNKTNTISVLPMSGYVIIKQNP